jgi:hypothetical protein
MDAYSSAAKIQIDSTLSLTTAPFRPASFTAVDDNTIGERMTTNAWPTYTGNADANAGQYGSPYLYFSSYSGTLSNLRFRYAGEAVFFDGSSGNTITLTDGQLLHCAQGIEVGYGSAVYSTVTFNNCLLHDVQTLVTDDGEDWANSYRFVNCTFDAIPTMYYSASGASLTFTNCVLGNITSDVTGLTGGFNGFYNATNFGSPYYSTGVSIGNRHGRGDRRI